MELWHKIINACLMELSLLSWHDYLEIFFFVVVHAFWLHWLNTDKQKNLSLLFCLYSLFTGACYYAQLTTISTLLLNVTPLVVVIFIMLHQEQLQRHFITLTRTSPPPPASHWLSECLSFALSALHRQQEIIFIIEKSDNLSLLLTAPCLINASVTKEVLEFMTSHHTSPATHIWLTSKGTIIGINTTLNYVLEQEFLIASTLKHLPPWQKEACFITKKTDALIFRGSLHTKTFDIICNGTLQEYVSAEHTFTFLKKYLENDSSHTQGIMYAPSQRSSNQIQH
jgi:hypothetical protein